MYREEIEQVFEQLTDQGIYCRGNYWCCGSCAGANIREDGKNAIGFGFWHEQDDEAAEGGNLYIGFGCIDSNEMNDELIDTMTLKVGKRIAGALRKAGGQITWDETPGKRILVSVDGWECAKEDDPRCEDCDEYEQNCCCEE